MMVEPSSVADLPPSSNEDTLELNKDLERMIESVENTAVQLTCMAYDIVTLRTSPEMGAALRELEEACDRCRAAVSGAPGQQAGLDSCPAEPAAAKRD